MMTSQIIDFTTKIMLLIASAVIVIKKSLYIYNKADNEYNKSFPPWDMGQVCQQHFIVLHVNVYCVYS